MKSHSKHKRKWKENVCFDQQIRHNKRRMAKSLSERKDEENS